MALRNLDEEESEIVKECMQCIANGEVILHDFEFQTIMGVNVEEFLEILNMWPNLDESDIKVRAAINNSMNNLIGYPHGMQKRWNDVMDTPLTKISDILQKWRSSNVHSYFEGME